MLGDLDGYGDLVLIITWSPVVNNSNSPHGVWLNDGHGRKCVTEEPATWNEGDWNGNGVYDQEDIVAALATGKYLQGPYAGRDVDAAFAGA